MGWEGGSHLRLFDFEPKKHNVEFLDKKRIFFQFQWQR